MGAPTITTQTASHPLPDGRFELLGAVDTVTGSMTKVESGGIRMLVDCGVAQGREARRWQFPEAARDVDAVILTHGHGDHVGSLPTLLAGGYHRPIFGTPQTLDITEVVLTDSLRIQDKGDADIRAFRAVFRSLARPVPYDTACTPPGFDGEVYFRDAGHILGSSSVEILSQQSRVICSGDLGRPNSPMLRDYYKAWRADRPLDLVMVESTYGDAEHSMDHDDVERQLERIILQALKDGGHILVPAFAIGRTQALIYHLNTLVEAGRLPDLPVAVDTPMGLRITELHRRATHLFDAESKQKLSEGDHPLDFDGLYAVRRGRDSARLRKEDDPVLFIAGSGMCTGGRIVSHLIELLPRPETCVLFVGYQAPGTPGRAIQQAKRDGDRVSLRGREVAVRAQVETLSGLSAHADRSELLGWLQALPSPRRIVINHGEPEAQVALRDAIERRFA